jgi:serine-type D-Ala-D-Ala carboxypeptidase/endopeptidase (penicillin-binding protein 4)
MNILIFKIWDFFRRITFLLSFLFVTGLYCENYCIEHATVSIYAVDTNTGEVLFDKNSNLSLIPASCMKIVTTVAALNLLGINNRFETNLEYDGFINKYGILEGNLYFRGGGDPCLGSDRINGNLSWKKQIETWADAIQKLGIKKIVGRIIADVSIWKKELAVPSWSWEDLGNYYGANASALSFHENFYLLFFKPGEKEGEKTDILYTEPPMENIIFKNEVTTGSKESGDNAFIFGSELSLKKVINGTIPLGVNEFVIKGSIPDPANCCIDLFIKELQRRGIIIELQDRSSSKKNVFYTTYSPTIKEIIYWTNQKSINLYAEHLLKKMGEVVYKDGSTSAGIKAVKGFWKSQGIDLDGFNMVDGSGLSRKNLITTKQLVKMLLNAKKSKYFPIFLDSLPQRNGSVKAKSGSMSLIKGYVGYKDNIAFAILVNQCFDQKKMTEIINLFLSNLNNESL